MASKTKPINKKKYERAKAIARVAANKPKAKAISKKTKKKGKQIKKINSRFKFV